MLKHLQIAVEDSSTPNPLLIVLDVSVVTLLLPALGWWHNPADPFFLHSDFPWLVLAPLIIGLRHGFARGLASAVALNLLMYAFFRLRTSAMPNFPVSLSLGLLLVAMLSGEFCDMWTRRLHRLSELSHYRHVLLQKFTRSFHLLSLSHERLERRVLTNTKSLREAMTYLRERALSVEPNSPDSEELHHLIMEVLSSFGWLQVAALYRVDEYGILVPRVVAKLGNPKPVRLEDPLLEQAIKTKQLTCIRPDDALLQGADGAEQTRQLKTLMMAIPLVDVHGRVWGVVAVQEMPFMALNQDQLNLLALLGGHLGDLLALAWGGALYQFHGCLLRSHSDAKKHKLAATLVAVMIDNDLAPPTLFTTILELHRGLDQQWLTKNRHGHRVLFLVLPLTDLDGARGFIQRLEEFCKDRHGRPLMEMGVRIQQRPLDGVGSAEDRLQQLKEACEINVA